MKNKLSSFIKTKKQKERKQLIQIQAETRLVKKMKNKMRKEGIGSTRELITGLIKAYLSEPLK